MNNNRVPMQHPFKKGKDGKPQIQLINKQTVDSGKASKMGYIPIEIAQAPPKPVPQYDIPEVQVSFQEQSAEINEEPKPKKAKITKAQPTKLKA